ncbi:adenylate/guanylate cyclase catalytic domain protein [Leptospira ryugenii]|uniref:Adenylate/guanylate cyclase catalytic domain protein n=1 Tax=Leptospira ryugenii TaxID=1917863 RepID=A0A2P2DVJ8_9LEPT|nr:adenylate/guanylate cyclase domain-containing protein [Leptospira ryugenii]GBF48645.1 adenylate/guanylate cyclase catalytic domain protein [Leptospira ryugenii]
MKIFGKDTHAHLRWPTKSQFWITGIGLIIASIAHYMSFLFLDIFSQAVTLRLYYVIVIYGASTSGLALGFISGGFAALLHYFIMQFPVGHGTEVAIHIEHHVEIPFLFLLGIITGAIRDHEIHEREQKNEINQHFGSYVSTEVRDDILKGNSGLGGDEVEVTILFADIRNFTSLSEKHTPTEVVTMLNQYFSEMVRCINEHGGTVNKFIGDGIMAVFGAPRSLENHALSAVLAAHKMFTRLQAHNNLKVANGEPTFAIGIGLHSGPVIIGNIGSDTRKEYTVIGDTVNIASRVEGMTKVYSKSLILTEGVKNLLPSNLEVREIDTVTLKGRSTPCILYEPII